MAANIPVVFTPTEADYEEFREILLAATTETEIADHIRECESCAHTGFDAKAMIMFMMQKKGQGNYLALMADITWMCLCFIKRGTNYVNIRNAIGDTAKDKLNAFITFYNISKKAKEAGTTRSTPTLGRIAIIGGHVISDFLHFRYLELGTHLECVVSSYLPEEYPAAMRTSTFSGLIPKDPEFLPLFQMQSLVGLSWDLTINPKRRGQWGPATLTERYIEVEKFQKISRESGFLKEEEKKAFLIKFNIINTDEDTPDYGRFIFDLAGCYTHVFGRISMHGAMPVLPTPEIIKYTPQAYSETSSHVGDSGAGGGTGTGVVTEPEEVFHSQATPSREYASSMTPIPQYLTIDGMTFNNQQEIGYLMTLTDVGRSDYVENIREERRAERLAALREQQEREEETELGQAETEQLSQTRDDQQPEDLP